MYGNQAFENVIRLLTEKDNYYMRLIEKYGLLVMDQFTLSVEISQELIDYGVFTFVNEEASQTKLRWTSNLLKEFIIHYAIIIKTALPSAPILEKKLDYSSLFLLIGQSSEVASLARYDQEEFGLDPLEAAFHAEFYRILKGIFLSTPWPQYMTPTHYVIYEGRLGVRRRRMDLLLLNSEKVVVEVKMLRKGKSPEAIIQDGIIQAHDYAQNIGASRVYLLICSNYDPDLQSPISVVQVRKKQEELHDSQYDEQEDPTYYPEENENQDTDSETKNSQMEIDTSSKANLPIKIILFKYIESWEKFLSLIELDVELKIQ